MLIEDLGWAPPNIFQDVVAVNLPPSFFLDIARFRTLICLVSKFFLCNLYEKTVTFLLLFVLVIQEMLLQV